MRTSFRWSISVGTMALLLSACGGSGSDGATTCGAGTHDAGNQTCVVDNAIAIVNGNSYWRCRDNSGGTEFLQFTAGGSATAGTGRYQFQATPVQPIYAFGWAEAVPSTNALTLSFASGPTWNLLKDITPNSLVNPTGFTANIVNNSGAGNLSCTLYGGTF